MIKLPSEPQRGEAPTAAWAQQVCRAIKALVPKPSRHILPNIGTGGTTYELREKGKNAKVPKHNFYISLKLVGDDLQASAADGTINGVTPFIDDGGDIPIDTVPAPTVTISPTGTVKAWFKIFIDPIAVNRGTIGTPKYRIGAGTVTGVEIVFAESAPAGVVAQVDITTGSPTSGTYVRRFGTIVDGIVVRPQPVKYSLSALLCDDGDSNGILSLGVGL